MDSTMVNIKIRLIILFAAKDGDALYSQQKKKVIVGQMSREISMQRLAQ